MQPARARRGSRPGPPSPGCRPPPGHTGSHPSRRSRRRSSGRRPSGPADDVGQGRPPRVVEVEGESIEGQAGVGRRSVRSATWSGTPTPIVSPKQISSAPTSTSSSAISTARAGLDAAGVGTAKRRRDVRPPPPAQLAGPLEDGRERVERIGHRHADVVLGERVGRRGEDRQRIGAGSLRPGSVHAGSGRARGSGRRAPRGGSAGARRRRPAGGSPAGRRSSSPRSRAGRPRRAAR